jgi:hypothetical protein
MTVTHILDGQELIQKQDAVGRTYFVDAVTKTRVKTAGKKPVALLTGDEATAAEIARLLSELPDSDDPFADVPEEDDPTLPDAPMPYIAPPGEIDFEDFAVAVEAHLRSYAYNRGVSARSNGDGSVTLSLPVEDGGHLRYRLEFPERVPVTLIPVE